MALTEACNAKRKKGICDLNDGQGEFYASF